MKQFSRIWTEQERAILQIVQRNIPDSLTPYASIAEDLKCTEQEVLLLLQQLKKDGIIRRFGASIKHQKAGYSHNAMVAWKIDASAVDEAGAIAQKHPLISHCYYRPSSAEDWPYEFFTMIHGKNSEECQGVIDYLLTHSHLKEYAILDSLKELKKTSMIYF